MYVRCDNQCKTGADRGNILGQPRLFECIGIWVLSPAHASEMRVYRVYVLIVKYLSHRFCLNSVTVYKIGRPYRGIFVCGFFETFLAGSMDRVIYRDHVVNQRFLIYCRLATSPLKSVCFSLRLQSASPASPFLSPSRSLLSPF